MTTDAESADTAPTGVFVADDEATRADAFAVRRTVFVEEQDVPEALEVDDHDETPETVHFVAYDEGDPVGAARLRPLDDATAKVERVAVVRSRRGEGWGSRLMDALESHARDDGVETLTMHAQVSAAAFYERRGYDRVGEVFEEAGIQHVKMTRSP